MPKKADPALVLAAQRGDKERLAAALKAGTGVEDCDRHGATFLHLAAGAGRLELVEFLLEQGAGVDKTDDAGNSPLMLAAARGQIEVVKRLLAAGADPKSGNRWGLTARNWAAWPKNAQEIEALLIANED